MADTGELVAFPAGTHVHRSALGTVTVHVPRDITAADLAPALARFEREMEDADDTKAPSRAA